MQSKVYCIFSVVSCKRNDTDKPSNVKAATDLFSSVDVIGMTCSMNVFLFYVIIERHYMLTPKLVYTCKFW